MAHFKHAILGIIGLLLMASAAWAQVNRGTITGIVADPSGAVIPGVAVGVTDQATGVATNVVSSSAGVYTAPLLLPATYTLTAQKDGFKKYVRAGIIVGVGDTVRADVSMTLGAKTETVTVTSQAPLLQRESAELGNVVTGQEVEELPLTSVGDQRTPASFMKLAPGVTGRGNSTGGPGGNQYMTTSVGGSIVSSTTLKLDGADFATVQGFEGDLHYLQIPPDAIGEFNLEATNPTAEYGRSVGGSASFQMKSGTNRIHGTAYEFVRNTDLNANYWFTNASTPGCEGNGVTTPPAGYTGPLSACKSPYKQNEFGVTAGGPIKKDKAFIFGYYDGFRLINSNGSSGTYFIPTQAMLQGNFTTDPGLPILADPVSQTTGYGLGPKGATAAQLAADLVCGQIICKNIVNPAFINPVSAKINPLFPHPTSSGVVNGVFDFHNWNSTASSPLSVNMWGLKGDYVFNDKNRVAVTFATGKNETPNTPGIPPPLQGGDQPSINLTRNYRVNWSLIGRPNLINQATLSFDQLNSGAQPISSYGGRSDWISYLGLKGLAPIYGTEFPQFVLDGFSYNGGGGAGLNNLHSEGVDDGLTWVKSKHTLKFGFQYMKAAVNTINSGRTGGYFNFIQNQTGKQGGLVDSSGNSIPTGLGTASYLLGYANEMQAQYIYAPSYSRVGYYAGYAQDDFKVTKKLTLNLGVRWDRFTPDFQKYYHKGWINPSVLNPDLTPNIYGVFQQASASNPYGVNTHNHYFSPRLGLAYGLNDKTVIRLGYGMMYGQGNANQVETGSYVQGFNGSTGATSSTLAPGFIWGVQSATPYVPSLTPLTDLGNGTPRHSAGSLMELWPSDGMAPYAQNWNITVQRQLPGQMTLTTAYVGNTGIHLPSRGLAPMDKMPPQYLSYAPLMASDGVTSMLYAPISDPVVQASAPIAAMPIDPATEHHSPFNGFEALYSAANGLAGIGTMGQALRQNPQYQGLHRYYESLGVSTYNALQVKLDKKFSNGLTLLVSYAWSKTLTDGGSMFSTFSSEFGSTTPWNRKAQKAYGFIDLPNNLSVSYIYNLPFGKGKKFVDHGGVANAIVGGWKWSGIMSYQSGAPQMIGTNPTQIPGGLVDQGHGNANRVPGVPVRDPSSLGHFDPNKDELINEKAFVMPAQWTNGTFQITEATIRSLPYLNEDMSLMKEWKFTPIHDEEMTLRFNADFFNIFNRTIFGLSGQNGAYAQEPYVNYKGYGALGGQTNNPRQIQFGLRLNW